MFHFHFYISITEEMFIIMFASL